MDSLLKHILHTHGLRYEPIDELNFKLMVYKVDDPKKNIVATLPLSDLQYGQEHFENILKDLIIKLNK